MRTAASLYIRAPETILLCDVGRLMMLHVHTYKVWMLHAGLTNNYQIHNFANASPDVNAGNIMFVRGISERRVTAHRCLGIYRVIRTVYIA